MTLDKQSYNKEIISNLTFKQFQHKVEGWVKAGTVEQPTPELIQKVYESLTGKKSKTE